MKTLYCDSSAYVKLFKHEPGTELVDLLFTLAHTGQIQIFMSYWTINETLAAIDKKHKLKEISDQDYPIICATITNTLRLYGTANVGIISVGNLILRKAIDIINQYHVSADDALHLATALLVQCDYFICHDQKLMNKTGNKISEMEILDISDGSTATILTRKLKPE